MSGAANGDRGLREEIAAFLDSQHVMSLATVVEGAAHAASVMYAAEDLVLYWASDQKTRHSLAIESDPRVSATVAPDYEDFRLIRGLQIAGRARRLSEAAHARELLRRRFSFLRDAALPAALLAALDKSAYYRLDPDTVTLIDNTRTFGSRRVLRIS